MNKNLYSIYDKKAGACLGIFECPNDLVALRDFSQTCSYKPEKDINRIAQYAEDYELLRLGKYNTATGEIEADKQVLASATDYVNKNS